MRAVKVRVLPEARSLVSGLTYSTALGVPGTTSKLVASVAREALEAVTVTLPTRTAVIVPLVAVPLATENGPVGRPVTVLPAASRMLAVKVRVLPEARSLVSGLTYSTALGVPGTTSKLVASVARAALEAVTVTLPTRTAVIVPLVAVPLATATGPEGRPVTVPGPAVLVKVMLPT